MRFVRRVVALAGGAGALLAMLLAAPALAVDPTSITRSGGLHFVGTPTVSPHKTSSTAFLTATGEVAGAGTSATATLTANVEVTSGCINKGSKNQQPSGLQSTTTSVSGSQPFQTRQGRATFTVSTSSVQPAACPDDMVPVLVSVTFTDVTLTVTSSTGTTTATFPDIDP